MGAAMRSRTLDVIYDAQCRFCLRSLRLLERLAGGRLFRLHNSNDRELMQSKFPVLAGADTDKAMFAVTPDGEVFRGFFAFRKILWESPRLYPFLPLFYAPGAALAGPRIYAWVANNRRSLGCSLDGCQSVRHRPPGENELATRMACNRAASRSRELTQEVPT